MNSSFFRAFLISILPLPLATFGQELNNVDSQENLYKIGGVDAAYGLVRKFDNRYEGVEGSPFYFDYWTEGTIALESDQQLKNVAIKYNMYEDELIINRNKAGQYYFPKNKIQSFTLIEKTLGEHVNFITHQHPKKKETLQFYRILVDDEVSLLEYVKVIFEKADFQGGYSNDKHYDEFKKYPSFYVTSSSSPVPQRLKSTPGAVSKQFPSHNAEIKNYINKQGLDCRNEQDLFKIFNYYLSLK